MNYTCGYHCLSEFDLYNHTLDKHPAILNKDFKTFKNLIKPYQKIIHCKLCCSDCKPDRDYWYGHMKSAKHIIKVYEYEKLLENENISEKVNNNKIKNNIDNDKLVNNNLTYGSMKELGTFDYALNTDKFDVFTIIITKNPSPSLLVSFQFSENRLKIKSFKKDPYPGPLELSRCVRVGDDLLGCQGDSIVGINFKTEIATILKDRYARIKNINNGFDNNNISTSVLYLTFARQRKWFLSPDIRHKMINSLIKYFNESFNKIITYYYAKRLESVIYRECENNEDYNSIFAEDKIEDIIDVYIKILNNCYYYQDIEKTILSQPDAADIVIDDHVLPLLGLYIYLFLLILILLFI